LSPPASTSWPELDDVVGEQLAHPAPAQHRLCDAGGIGPVVAGLDQKLETLGLHDFLIG
jgi:hypothetical protein